MFACSPKYVKKLLFSGLASLSFRKEISDGSRLYNLIPVQIILTLVLGHSGITTVHLQADYLFVFVCVFVFPV